MDRDPTSDAELDAAITAAAARIRWVYCRDAGWDGTLDDWPARVPAHVVIAALAREAQEYSEVIQRERAGRRAAEAAVRALEAGARRVIDEAAGLAVGEQLELL